MPVLRSPFVASLSTSEPIVLNAERSGASFTLFVSGITAGPSRSADEWSTLYVRTDIMTEPVAIGSVASGQGTQRIRAVVPVKRGMGDVTLSIVGTLKSVSISGDQHTRMSREQVDAVGSKAAAAV